MNNISLKNRFYANVLVDGNGDILEITENMFSYLRLQYRSRHFWCNTVEDRFDITDLTDREKEEVIFLSDPKPRKGELLEKIARMLMLEVKELKPESACTLAKLAMRVTNLHLVILPEEY